MIAVSQEPVLDYLDELSSQYPLPFLFVVRHGVGGQYDQIVFVPLYDLV